MQAMEGEFLLVLEWSGQQLPVTCPSFRGHCCAPTQSKSNSSGRDGDSTGEGLS